MLLRKPNILVCMKPFGKYPKHQPKIDMIQALEAYANVYYWYKNGHIIDILNELTTKPDFIFHYDIAWNYALAPKIEGLANIDIPVGCFVIDLHWHKNERIKYFENNNVDIIFSVSKHPFLNVFPQYEKKLSWMPWSINPQIMKDWKQKKDIQKLLLGLVHIDSDLLNKRNLPKLMPPKGRYAFRDAVFQQMKSTYGFVFHPHPGHRTIQTDHLIVNERYAKELNRAKIFFTCGSRQKSGGIAVLKFFEALACKTLLLAEENEDIIELGFKDEDNFVSCTIQNVAEKAQFYVNNDHKRQRIMNNGYHFIHTEHTNDRRAQQMIEVIKTFI